MKKLGIIVDNVGQYEPFVLLWTGMDACLKKHGDLSICVFQENPGVPVGPIPCPSFTLNEVYGFSGDVVATSIGSAAKLIGVTGPHRKYFLITELEWLNTAQPVQYEMVAGVYQNKELSLLVTNELYRDIIKNNFDREAVVLDKFSLLENIVDELWDVNQSRITS